MEKAIYGLAADFNAVHYDITKETTNFFYVDTSSVQYAKNVAFTLEHKAKDTITTTLNAENGKLILVQRGSLLFFKFIPTTLHGERIYRYVKQRKYRQCSYIMRIHDAQDVTEVKHLMDRDETFKKYKITVCEVCLTNNPRDKNTFCTTDAAHPLLRGIDWSINVTQNKADYWSEQILYDELDEQIEQIQRELKISERKTKKILLERGIK